MIKTNKVANGYIGELLHPIIVFSIQDIAQVYLLSHHHKYITMIITIITCLCYICIDCSPYIYCYQTIDTLKQSELSRRQMLDYLLER